MGGDANVQIWRITGKTRKIISSTVRRREIDHHEHCRKFAEP